MSIQALKPCDLGRHASALVVVSVSFAGVLTIAPKAFQGDTFCSYGHMLGGGVLLAEMRGPLQIYVLKPERKWHSRFAWHESGASSMPSAWLIEAHSQLPGMQKSCEIIGRNLHSATGARELFGVLAGARWRALWAKVAF